MPDVSLLGADLLAKIKDRHDQGNAFRIDQNIPPAESVMLPTLFVLDRDPHSLGALLSDLSRRFGNDFSVAGESSP